MGIRFHCPNGHKLNVKAFLAGKRGICPKCGARFEIPLVSETAHQTNHNGPVAAAWSPPANLTIPTIPGAVADPIAEAPNAVWYVRSAAGAEYGPATGDAMRTWLAEGRVTADSWVWREGWPDWRQANALFAQFMRAAAPVPVAPITVAPAPPAFPAISSAAEATPAVAPNPDGFALELDWSEEAQVIDTEPVDPLTATAMRHAAQRENFRRNMLVMTAVLIASALILVVVAVYLVLVRPSPSKPADDKPPAASSDLEPQRSLP